ncbi:unnamed protein product [Knipowitschia caucasica]
MAFSDPAKFVLLAIAIAFVLFALGFLMWQVYKYFIHTQENCQKICEDLPSEIKHPRYRGVEDPNTDPICGLSSSSLTSSEYGQLNGDMEEPVKVGGRLHFSLHYDQLQSRLVVTVLQLQNIQQHWANSSFQFFIKILLLWDKSHSDGNEVYQDIKDQHKACVLWTVVQEWRSHIVTDGSCPLFGNRFSSVLPEHINLHDIILKMEVRGKLSRNTALGEVRVSLKSLNITKPIELLKELQTPKKDLVGELLLSLQYLPSSKRLEIGLLKVKVVTVNTFMNAAVCAKIIVKCNQYRQETQKSSVVSYSTVTVFNETFSFTMPNVPLVKCKISVMVFEREVRKRNSPKRLIGQVVLGKEKKCEDKHWTLMMCSPHPVALWHGVLL